MYRLLLILIIALSVSCSSSKQAVQEYDFNEKGGTAETMTTNTMDPDGNYDSKVTASDKDLVRQMCNCSWDIIRINRDTKRFHKNNDKNGLLNLKPKVAPAYAKFDKCMNDLKQRNAKKIAATDPNIMMAAMQMECPELVDILEFTEPMKSGAPNK